VGKLFPSRLGRRCAILLAWHGRTDALGKPTVITAMGSGELASYLYWQMAVQWPHHRQGQILGGDWTVDAEFEDVDGPKRNEAKGVRLAPA